ncbi:hypothetical protein ACFQVC_42300 [Streptomyces monticola]|uniref:Uncharacterized protein n=1 Tax=Streptomyces monticola TaxID=2666263 RepID=A0ABW2JZ79_9ACTN
MRFSSRSTLQASQAVGAASAGGHMGRDEALNAEAKAAEETAVEETAVEETAVEESAVEAAVTAGWMEPGREYLTQSSADGEYTISLADVMHLEH